MPGTHGCDLSVVEAQVAKAPFGELGEFTCAVDVRSTAVWYSYLTCIDCCKMLPGSPLLRVEARSGYKFQARGECFPARREHGLACQLSSSWGQLSNVLRIEMHGHRFETRRKTPSESGSVWQLENKVRTSLAT